MGFHPTVEHNETLLRPYNVTPTMTGTDMPLTFLLYMGEKPADSTVDSA